MIMQAIPFRQLTQEEELEHSGWLSYYSGQSRQSLRSEEERIGWDDAAGEMAFHRAMLQQQEVDEAQSGHCDVRWA